MLKLQSLPDEPAPMIAATVDQIMRNYALLLDDDRNRTLEHWSPRRNLAMNRACGTLEYLGWQTDADPDALQAALLGIDWTTVRLRAYPRTRSWQLCAVAAEECPET